MKTFHLAENRLLGLAEEQPATAPDVRTEGPVAEEPDLLQQSLHQLEDKLEQIRLRGHSLPEAEREAWDASIEEEVAGIDGRMTESRRDAIAAIDACVRALDIVLPPAELPSSSLEDAEAAVPRDHEEQTEAASTPGDSAELARQNEELRRQVEELTKQTDALRQRVEELERQAGSPEQVPVAPATSPESPPSRLEREAALAEEVATLKAERLRIDVDWKATIGQGYDALHANDDAGFKTLDQMEIRAKQLDALIAQREAELKALQEAAEAPSEDVDALLAERAAQNERLTKLALGETGERDAIRLRMEAVDDRLGTIRARLDEQLSTLPLGSTSERERMRATIAAIDAVIPREGSAAPSSPDGVPPEEAADRVTRTPEQEREHAVLQRLQRIVPLLTLKFGSVTIPNGNLLTLDGAKYFLVKVLEAAKPVPDVPIYLQDGTIYAKQTALWIDSLNPDGIIMEKFDERFMEDPVRAITELDALCKESVECSDVHRAAVAAMAACVSGDASPVTPGA